MEKRNERKVFDMIELKELENRRYEGKDCTAFTYNMTVDKDLSVEYRFYRSLDSEVLKRTWIAQVIFPRTEQADSQMYYIGFELPKDNLPLTLVCATGLRYFQMCMKAEVQKKSNIDFTIGEITRGM